MTAGRRLDWRLGRADDGTLTAVGYLRGERVASVAAPWAWLRAACMRAAELLLRLAGHL